MKLNWQRFGNSKNTIVLLHYFGGNAESWKWVTERLKEDFSVVVITLPGFGNTPAFSNPDILEYASYINQCLVEINTPHFILCGHSMSGKLILYAEKIAFRFKAKALVLIAPSPPTVENMDESEKKRMLPKPTKESAKVTVDSSIVKVLSKNRRLIAEGSQLQVNEKTWRWWLERGMQHNIADRVQGIDRPTFVICAEQDPVISMDDIYNEVLPNLKQPQLIKINDCGHLIPLEAPIELARHLREIANAILIEE